MKRLSVMEELVSLLMFALDVQPTLGVQIVNSQLVMESCRTAHLFVLDVDLALV